MHLGTVNSTDFLEKVPIEFVDKEVILTVTLNGVTHKFILDTGAPTVLSKSLADSLNLTPLFFMQTSDVHKNKSSLPITKADEICIGKLKFTNQGAAIYDFSKNKEISCSPFNSIIGANLMKSAIWQINIKDKIIYITNDIKKLNIPKSAIKFGFMETPSETPIINVTIDSININHVTLDYGSGSGVDLVSEKLIDKIHTEKKNFVRMFGYNSVGLFGGKNDTTYFINDSVKIESNSLDAQEISIRRTGISTIGTQVLKNYIVTLDWNNDTIYMEKIASEALDKINTFGFTAVLTNGKLIVTSITEKSSAVENGIVLGDQIMSVNGKDYTTVSSDDYCNYITNGMVPKDVNTVEISFKHNDVLKKVKLERRDPLSK